MISGAFRDFERINAPSNADMNPSARDCGLISRWGGYFSMIFPISLVSSRRDNSNSILMIFRVGTLSLSRTVKISTGYFGRKPLIVDRWKSSQRPITGRLVPFLGFMGQYRLCFSDWSTNTDAFLYRHRLYLPSYLLLPALGLLASLVAPQSLAQDQAWTLYYQYEGVGSYGGWSRGQGHVQFSDSGKTVEATGPLTFGGTNMADATGALVVRGRIQDGVLFFVPDERLTIRVGAYSAPLDLFEGEAEISVPLEDGAELTFEDQSPTGSGKVVWRVSGQSRLVALTVISGATQKNVISANNWAAVRHESESVVVKATTKPDKMSAWKQIQWSGDAGVPVLGKPNQRRIPRAKSKRHRLKASLGGNIAALDVWVIWATVTVRTKASDSIPKGFAHFGNLFDGTEKLGAVTYDDGKQAAGKIAASAKITPRGIHRVVTKGWKFRRQKHGVRFANGKVDLKWPTWGDGADDSKPQFLKLTPDAEDQIYDIDAPTIGGARWNETNEAYINFRQWVEWNGERCSDFEPWYWRAQWDFSHDPEVTHKEVGFGVRPVPGQSLMSRRGR